MLFPRPAVGRAQTVWGQGVPGVQPALQGSLQLCRSRRTGEVSQDLLRKPWEAAGLLLLQKSCPEAPQTPSLLTRDSKGGVTRT